MKKILFLFMLCLTPLLAVAQESRAISDWPEHTNPSDDNDVIIGNFDGATKKITVQNFQSPLQGQIDMLDDSAAVYRDSIDNLHTRLVAEENEAGGGGSTDSSWVKAEADTMYIGSGKRYITGGVESFSISGSSVYLMDPTEIKFFNDIVPSSNFDLGTTDDPWRSVIVSGLELQPQSEPGYKEGYVYYDSDDDLVKVYNGSEIDTLTNVASASADSTFATVQTDSLKTFAGNYPVAVSDIYDAVTNTIDGDSVYHSLQDTLSFVFGLGSDQDGDTAAFNVGAGLGGWYQFQDSIVPREVRGTILGGDSGDSITFEIYWDADGSGIPTDTILTTTGLGYDGGPIQVTTFNELILPPGYVYGRCTGVPGDKPKWVLIPFGYSEKRRE